MTDRRQELIDKIQHATNKKQATLANAECFEKEFSRISEHFIELADDIQVEINAMEKELQELPSEGMQAEVKESPEVEAPFLERLQEGSIQEYSHLASQYLVDHLGISRVLGDRTDRFAKLLGHAMAAIIRTLHN